MLAEQLAATFASEAILLKTLFRSRPNALTIAAAASAPTWSRLAILVLDPAGELCVEDRQARQGFATYRENFCYLESGSKSRSYCNISQYFIIKYFAHVVNYFFFRSALRNEPQILEAKSFRWIATADFEPKRATEELLIAFFGSKIVSFASGRQ